MFARRLFNLLRTCSRVAFVLVCCVVAIELNGNWASNCIAQTGAEVANGAYSRMDCHTWNITVGYCGVNLPSCEEVRAVCVFVLANIALAFIISD